MVHFHLVIISSASDFLPWAFESPGGTLPKANCGWDPGFIESFLWHCRAGAGCRLRDLHSLTGPYFHGVHLELLRSLHADIHWHTCTLLHGTAHVLGATFHFLWSTKSEVSRIKVNGDQVILSVFAALEFLCTAFYQALVHVLFLSHYLEK